MICSRTSLAASALALTGRRVDASPAPAAEFPKAPGLTKSVAEFIVNTKYEDIPPDVIELGKKSILDGFGLALAGSASVMGPIARKYVESFGSGEMRASVIGTGMKAHPRFAAFVNGVSIHADDYDDTQLSAAKDRIYGLLTHPTVSVLPPAFALCELGHRSGKDFMVAYHMGVEVETKINEAISPRHYDEGFHSTGTCGTFGSTAACAQTARPECAANHLRPGNRRHRRRRLPRQFRFHDQAVSGGTRRGKRDRRGRSRRARMDRGRSISWKRRLDFFKPKAADSIPMRSSAASENRGRWLRRAFRSSRIRPARCPTLPWEKCCA